MTNRRYRPPSHRAPVRAVWVELRHPDKLRTVRIFYKDTEVIDVLLGYGWTIVPHRGMSFWQTVR